MLRKMPGTKTILFFHLLTIFLPKKELLNYNLFCSSGVASSFQCQGIAYFLKKLLPFFSIHFERPGNRRRTTEAIRWVFWLALHHLNENQKKLVRYLLPKSGSVFIFSSQNKKACVRGFFVSACNEILAAFILRIASSKCWLCLGKFSFCYCGV